MSASRTRKTDSTVVQPEELRTTIQESPSMKAARTRKRDLSFLDSIPSRIGIVIISGIVFVGLWEIFYLIVGNTLILASPASVAGSLGFLLSGGIPIGSAGLENVYSAVGNTALLIAVGYAISLVGIPIGIVMGRWRTAEIIIDPWINMIYSIPMVAVTPLIYPLLGATFQAAVLVVILISIFTIMINTYSGVKYTSNALAEVGKTFGATERQFLTKIIFPASLPDIVAGMRLGLGRAVLGAVVAQVLVTSRDLGQMLLAFQDLLDTPNTMAIIVLIALIGIAALQTPRIIEHYKFKWKETERIQRGLRH
jgi:ABC-type nitrate/sulfonate/bicarbonate transport system permease component